MYKYLKLFEKPKHISIGFSYFGDKNVPVFLNNTNFQRKLSISAIFLAKKGLKFSVPSEKPTVLEPQIRRGETKLEKLFFRDILAECGITGAVNTKNYVTILTSPVGELKSSGILSANANVPHNLIKQFKNVELSADSHCFDDSMPLDTIRLFIVKMYLKKMLQINDQEFERLFMNHYATILSKPLGMLKEVYELLTIEYKLSTTQIKHNIPLLSTDPEDLRDTTKFKKSIWKDVVESLKKTQPWVFGNPNMYTNTGNAILGECGLDITTNDHRKELAEILYSPVGVLKKMGYIPMDVDVPKRLSEQFKDVKLQIGNQHFDESMPLGTVRYLILKAYMNAVMVVSDSQFHHHLCKPFSDQSHIRNKMDFKQIEKSSKPMKPWLAVQPNDLNKDACKSILLECGFRSVSAKQCEQYEDIMKSTVKHLKEVGYLPMHLNVSQHLANQVKETSMPLGRFKFTETARLGSLRYSIVRFYVNALVGIRKNVHNHLLHGASRQIIERPLSEIREVNKVLTEGFGFKQKELREKIYLLGSDLQSIYHLLGMNTIAGMDVRILAKEHPMLLREKVTRNIPTILNHLRSFNIPDSSVQQCKEILLVQPERVLERLTTLRNDDSLNRFFEHPEFLYAVVNYDKLMGRLECINLMPERKKSLSFNFIMQSDDDQFVG